MKRRRFVKMLTSGFLIPWIGAFAENKRQYIDVSGLIFDVEAARSVGRVYLQSHPYLTKHMLIINLGLESRSTTTGLDQMFYDRIRDDFSSSRTVIVEGWLLAQSEAAACGLVALGITRVPRFS